jgi:hypothetical protein
MSVEEYLKLRNVLVEAEEKVTAKVRKLTAASSKMAGFGWKSNASTGEPSLSMQRAAKRRSLGAKSPTWPSVEEVSVLINAYFQAAVQADAAYESLSPEEKEGVKEPPL